MVHNNKHLSQPPENWTNQMADKVKQSLPTQSPPENQSLQQITGSLTHDNNQVKPQKTPNHTITNCFPMEFGPSPKKLIDGLRNASGSERLDALMSFQSNLDQMSESQLEKSQNYLVDLMSSPHNHDDELLGSLLKAVNQELSSRHDPFPPKPFPIKPFPPGPKPININDIINDNGKPRPVD